MSEPLIDAVERLAKAIEDLTEVLRTMPREQHTHIYPRQPDPQPWVSPYYGTGDPLPKPPWTITCSVL